MPERGATDITRMIDERGLGGMQILVVGLCGLVALFDGMDLQSIGLAAPLMAGALHVAPQAFGAVFSAALAGLTLGALALGPLADRLGRKSVLIAATLCFGIFSLCTAFADDLGVLLVYRFLTGVGLGGAMPAFISLASEYVPHRLRAGAVSLMWAGFPLGGVVGGLLASRLIPAFGWRSVFFAGGVPPLLLAVVLVPVLPESLGYLIASDAPPARVARTLRRVFGDVATTRDARFVVTAAKHSRARLGDLFVSGRALGTVLLWIAFFFAFLILVTNSAWSPTLLGLAGVPIASSAIAMAVFNFGSLFGTGAAGWLLARLGTVAVLPVSIAVSALAYALVGLSAPSMVGDSRLRGIVRGFRRLRQLGPDRLGRHPLSDRGAGDRRWMGDGRRPLRFIRRTAGGGRSGGGPLAGLGGVLHGWRARGDRSACRPGAWRARARAERDDARRRESNSIGGRRRLKWLN